MRKPSVSLYGEMGPIDTKALFLSWGDAQGVKCLLFKNEDLSSDSQFPCKSQNRQHIALISEEGRQEREMELTSQIV